MQRLELGCHKPRYQQATRSLEIGLGQILPQDHQKKHDPAHVCLRLKATTNVRPYILKLKATPRFWRDCRDE